jgi:hypothetical protein
VGLGGSDATLCGGSTGAAAFQRSTEGAREAGGQGEQGGPRWRTLHCLESGLAGAVGCRLGSPLSSYRLRSTAFGHRLEGVSRPHPEPAPPPALRWFVGGSGDLQHMRGQQYPVSGSHGMDRCPDRTVTERPSGKVAWAARRRQWWWQLRRDARAQGISRYSNSGAELLVHKRWMSGLFTPHTQRTTAATQLYMVTTFCCLQQRLHRDGVLDCCSVLALMQTGAQQVAAAAAEAASVVAKHAAFLEAAAARQPCCRHSRDAALQLALLSQPCSCHPNMALPFASPSTSDNIWRCHKRC